jgi:hypothetical protein
VPATLSGNPRVPNRLEPQHNGRPLSSAQLASSAMTTFLGADSPTTSAGPDSPELDCPVPSSPSLLLTGSQSDLNRYFFAIIKLHMEDEASTHSLNNSLEGGQ